MKTKENIWDEIVISNLDRLEEIYEYEGINIGNFCVDEVKNSIICCIDKNECNEPIWCEIKIENVNRLFYENLVREELIKHYGKPEIKKDISINNKKGTLLSEINNNSEYLQIGNFIVARNYRDKPILKNLNLNEYDILYIKDIRPYPILGLIQETEYPNRYDYAVAKALMDSYKLNEIDLNKINPSYIHEIGNDNDIEYFEDSINNIGDYFIADDEFDFEGQHVKESDILYLLDNRITNYFVVLKHEWKVYDDISKFIKEELNEYYSKKSITEEEITPKLENCQIYNGIENYENALLGKSKEKISSYHYNVVNTSYKFSNNRKPYEVKFDILKGY